MISIKKVYLLMYGQDFNSRRKKSIAEVIRTHSAQKQKEKELFAMTDALDDENLKEKKFTRILGRLLNKNAVDYYLQNAEVDEMPLYE